MLQFPFGQIKARKSSPLDGFGLSKRHPPPGVVDIDAADATNELAVTEYVDELYRFYKIAEVGRMSDKDYVKELQDLADSSLSMNLNIEIDRRICGLRAED